MGIFGLLTMRGAKTAVAAAQGPTRELAPLQLIQKIPVPGVAGRIDHFTAFPKRRLLIFAGLGNNSMEIVNTFQAKVVQSVKGLDEPQGVLYVPGLDKIFVANAGSGVVKVYDGKTYALRKSIALGEESDTDNLRWDEDSKRVFVGIVGGIAMIDAVTEAHQLALDGANGKPITDQGKDMAVWKKQPDGAWKMVADTFNSDLAVKSQVKTPETNTKQPNTVLARGARLREFIFALPGGKPPLDVILFSFPTAWRRPNEPKRRGIHCGREA
jgi:hypothetical protein